MLLIIPLTQLSTVSDRVFRTAASRIWNSLPLHVTSAQSLQTFRRRGWSRFLFSHSFPSQFLVLCNAVTVLWWLATFGLKALLVSLLNPYFSWVNVTKCVCFACYRQNLAEMSNSLWYQNVCDHYWQCYISKLHISVRLNVFCCILVTGQYWIYTLPSSLFINVYLCFLYRFRELWLLLLHFSNRSALIDSLPT